MTTKKKVTTPLGPQATGTIKMISHHKNPQACAACRKPVKQGDTIYWNPHFQALQPPRGQVRHEKCGDWSYIHPRHRRPNKKAEFVEFNARVHALVLKMIDFLAEHGLPCQMTTVSREIRDLIFSPPSEERTELIYGLMSGGFQNYVAAMGKVFMGFPLLLTLMEEHEYDNPLSKADEFEMARHFCVQWYTVRGCVYKVHYAETPEEPPPDPNFDPEFDYQFRVDTFKKMYFKLLKDGFLGPIHDD